MDRSDPSAYGSSTECGCNELQGKSQRNRSSTRVKFVHQGFEEDAEGIDGNGNAPKESNGGPKHYPPAIKDLRGCCSAVAELSDCACLCAKV